MAVMLMLAAAGWIPASQSGEQAPASVLLITAMVILTAGCMLLIDRQQPLNDLLAAVLLAGMGLLGAWVALFAQPGSISGGLPLLPSTVNHSLGRLVFGGGALISWSLAIYALRLYRKGSKLSSQNRPAK
ncbi:MAG: hypothetical protein Tsb002_22240 [Wenzhouxiangellaceae bacterium]